jgi:hypothetical protein
LFSWFRNRRRRKLLAAKFPMAWEQILVRNVPHDRWLSDAARIKLRRCVRVFVAEKNWEGCNGQPITDEVRVTIAGHACLLLLGFENEYFDRLQTVLVYPDMYVAKQTDRRPGGVIGESYGVRLGEAHSSGPVILSWQSVVENSRGETNGRNVVVHEFAHVLDMQNDEVDGIPPLGSPEQIQRWKEVMSEEYQQLVAETTAGNHTLLDPYGTTSEIEFFAVATESFFEQPVELKDRHRNLYNVLRDFYRQDLATSHLSKYAH